MRPFFYISRNVSHLQKAAFFYSELGFIQHEPAGEDIALAEILGVSKVSTLRMQLGAQSLELCESHPRGRPYPAQAKSDDVMFQHIALVTTDISLGYERAMQAGATPISTQGPVTLPAASGGVTAWKFRDPDLHPLELLFLPESDWWGDALMLGYDHSALVVRDVERSKVFYGRRGFTEKHRQLNQGVQQEALDGLPGAKADIVTLAASAMPPHIELLGYASVTPLAGDLHPSDIAADRLVFGQGKIQTLERDPDGHFLLMRAGTLCY